MILWAPVALLVLGLCLVAYSHWIWSGLTERVTATAGDNVPAEIEIVNRRGVVVGFWAYGCYDPAYPYPGGD